MKTYNTNTSTTPRVSAHERGIEIDIEDEDNIGIGPESRKVKESTNNHVPEEPPVNSDKDITPPKKRARVATPSIL